jgi:transcription initiation factor IIE alpha subunit
MKTQLFTTKDVAAKFKITTRLVRRILRAMKNDGKYTRYQLTAARVEQIGKQLAA